MAVELEERRLDLAEKNIYEALTSDDPRRRDAASMFTIRNSHRARRRGWITTRTSVAELSVTANAPTRTLTFRWRTPEDDLRDAEAAEAERTASCARWQYWTPRSALRRSNFTVEHGPTDGLETLNAQAGSTVTATGSRSGTPSS